MKVRNVNGTTGLSCKCGSWLDHWKKFSGQTCQYCSQSSCRNPPDVGGHVQKVSSTDNSWYIIPLCHSHNQKSSEMEIMDSRVFVSAVATDKCGK